MLCFNMFYTFLVRCLLELLCCVEKSFGTIHQTCLIPWFFPRPGDGSPNQSMPWDPTVDFQFMWANTQDFMYLGVGQ